MPKLFPDASLKITFRYKYIAMSMRVLSLGMDNL